MTPNLLTRHVSERFEKQETNVRRILQRCRILFGSNIKSVFTAACNFRSLHLCGVFFFHYFADKQLWNTPIICCAETVSIKISFSLLCKQTTAVRTARREVKLKCILCFGSNRNAFYLYRATSAANTSTPCQIYANVWLSKGCGYCTHLDKLRIVKSSYQQWYLFLM